MQHDNRTLDHPDLNAQPIDHSGTRADEQPLETLFPPAIDATMRSSFLTCPHLFFRRHCQGLTTAEAISIDLHFGACFAKGLETVRRAYWGGEPQGMAVVRGSEAIITAWAGYEYVPKTKAQEKKTLDACLLALTDYFMMWDLNNDPVKIHVHNGEPCIEFSGACPIPGVRHPTTGEPLLYAGRFDLIGDYEQSVHGLDDKTGRISGDDASKWHLRGQFTGYCWIAHSYGLPLKGFLVREVEPLIHSTKLVQQITPRPPWAISQWLRQLQADAAHMIEAWKQWQHYDLYNFDQPNQHPFGQVLDEGCYHYNRPCEMQPLCTAEHPERWLDSYHVSRWNPLVRGTR